MRGQGRYFKFACKECGLVSSGQVGGWSGEIPWLWAWLILHKHQHMAGTNHLLLIPSRAKNWTLENCQVFGGLSQSPHALSCWPAGTNVPQDWEREKKIPLPYTKSLIVCVISQTMSIVEVWRGSRPTPPPVRSTSSPSHKASSSLCAHTSHRLQQNTRQLQGKK